MRTFLPLISSALAFSSLVGCADGPCAGVEGPVLFAWDDTVDHRLEGTNPLAYDSIGAAVDAATPGTTVCISAGTWQEELHIDKPGIALRGAGTDRTVIEPRHPFSDPRESDATIVEISAPNVTLNGLQLRGGRVGLKLNSATNTSLRDVELRTNTIGLHSKDIAALDARGIALVRNTSVGGLFEHQDQSPFSLELMDLRVEGNGQRGVSAVGGIRSEHPLVLTRAHFQDNTGVEAGDLLSNGLDALDLSVGQPFSQDNAPRIRVLGQTIIHEALIHLLGGGLDIDCQGQSLGLVNLALSDADQGEDSPPLLQLKDCKGEMQHLTLAKLVGDERGTGLRILGDSDVVLENSALIQLEIPLSVSDANLESNNNFKGSLTEAALLSPIGAHPNLRPQQDSPLIDAATDRGIQRDLEGWSRPLGGAPDIGAYERR